MKLKKILMGALIVVLVLVLIMGGGFAYLYLHGMSGMSNTTEAKAGQIKVACVGDSITYGHGLSGWPKNSYPALLQGLLKDSYHVNNYGVSSYAVQEKADRSYRTLPHYEECLAYDPDIVVFMMGSNDSKPENWKDADTFRKDLESLLDSFGDAQIILCTPATAFFLEGQTEGVTEHSIQPLVVEEIAQVVRDVAAERGYTLLDIHALTAENPQWFTKDGVHPDTEGAAAIAQAVCNVIS